LPAADVLYACVLSNAAHFVMQSAAFWYWWIGLPAASLGSPVKGASVEPQALSSMEQKLVQASPHVPGAAALVLSPPGPAWMQ
jgi:hypothetical protein